MAQLLAAGVCGGTTSPSMLQRCLQPWVSPGLPSKASQNLAWITPKASVCILKWVFAQQQLMPDRTERNCTGILPKTGFRMAAGLLPPVECFLGLSFCLWDKVNLLEHSDHELWVCLLLLSDLRLKICQIRISYVQCEEHIPANKTHEAKIIISLNLHIYIIQLYFCTSNGSTDIQYCI